ncbi:TPA: oxygenase MpaB family protein, partial [Stenotrophomonas maltophilia]
ASAKLMQGMAPLFRRALPDGLASRACARMGVPVSVLREWPTVPR